MPSRCSVCKQGKGAPLGHNWVEASCTMAKHCSRCMLTQGEPIGHVWTVVESIKPSCSEGREVSRCVCGEESIVTTPSILGFHYCDSNGYCSVCNNTYDPSKMTLDEIVVNASHTVKCGVFSTPETRTSVYRPITPGDVNIPIVDLNGNLSSVTTGTYIDIPFSYADGDFTFDCIASIRIQGASSTGYPKKNYSIKLYEADGTKNKVKLREDWTKEFKYCLKANWVDYSQARNVVSGQLYGDVIRARDIEDELSGLVNGGAIDGFPVLVFNNGAFHGLYTLNIPKDKWMFDMKDSDEKNQAIVMGEHWGNSVAMRELISYSPNTTTWTHMSKWELEFASNEESLVDNSTVWVLESLNNLIRFVMNNNGEDFKNGISQYADVDKCIDSMLYTFFICADDNISKNILWVTYDGTHWFSSVYDMDGTWGLQWNGNLTFKDANTHLINILENHNNSNYNLLWEKLYLNFYDKIVERYWELRASVFNMEHITSRFEAFFNSIPDYVREAEREKWTGVPSQTTNNLEQILDFAKKRIEKMDAILVPKN